MSVTISPCRVNRRSKEEIRKVANTIREMRNTTQDFMDVLRVMEMILPRMLENFSYLIVEQEEWEETYGKGERKIEALTKITEDSIVIYLPEEVYYGAKIGRPRARFTVAHEIAHAVLHSNVSQEFKREEGEKYGEDKTCDPENQANEFAAELLCPTKAAKKMKLMDIQVTFGVSHTVAQLQKRK